ncbi:MAG TPA: metallophosphoesterase family protein [Victivallales bacterium]|nr:metallophosphoesterase family protein [Victivallales bacterium]
MIYAIISDIHANSEAFEAVLTRCFEEHIDKFICLGDIVGYNASPSECIKMIKNLDIEFSVLGNHDEYAGSDISLIGCNPLAKKGIFWTREQLTKDQRKWLMTPKLKIVNIKDKFTLVHGTLDSPSSWGYIFDAHDAHDNFIYQMTQITFCGHTHIPALFIKDSSIHDEQKQISVYKPWNNIDIFESEVSLKLDRDMKYLVNPGSIGQPRNGDPRASFCIFDTRSRVLKRICVEYDIKAAQDKIKAAGLPEELAYRLEKGC